VRAVKARSRAQRGRSNAERLDGADANLTIEVDGPAADSRIQRRFSPAFADTSTLTTALTTMPFDFDAAEIANVSRRQRQRGVSDPLVAAGEIAHAVKSRGRSRHGSYTREPPGAMDIAGGTNRRRSTGADKCRWLLALVERLDRGKGAPALVLRTLIHGASRGEHLARAPVPPPVPLAA